MAAGIAMSVIVATIVITPDPARMRPGLAALAGLLGAFTVFVLVQARRWRKATAQAARREGLVCPRCQYDLRDLVRGMSGSSEDKPGTVRCPECGQLSLVSELAKAWEA